MKKLTRYLIPRLADRFFVVSEYIHGEFRRHGVPEHRLRLLYNPIDLERFRPDAEARARLRGQLGIAETEVLAGYLGRIVHSKGVFVLAEAAALSMERMPDLRLLWVGEGGDLEQLRRSIAPEHRARHHFMNWNQAPEAIYPALDLALMPSIAPESFGRVSAEAQACGVPVLCSDIGGLRETLQPELSGLLTAPGEAAALCERMLQLALDPERRLRMGAQGRQFVAARFSSQQVCEQFTRQLRGVEAITQHPASGGQAQPA